MRLLFACIAVILLALGSGCSRVQVSQDFRPGTDFSRYATYQWQVAEPLESSDPRVSNPLLRERFQQAIDRELVFRGLVSKSGADLQIAYTYTIMTRVESDPFGTTIGFGVGRHYRYGGIGFGTSGDVRQYDVGMLVIDIYETGSGSLLWRGSGSEIVTTHSSPEETTAFVRRMVSSIMQQFPPAP